MELCSFKVNYYVIKNKYFNQLIENICVFFKPL